MCRAAAQQVLASIITQTFPAPASSSASSFSVVSPSGRHSGQEGQQLQHADADGARRGNISGSRVIAAPVSTGRLGERSHICDEWIEWEEGGRREYHLPDIPEEHNTSQVSALGEPP